MTERPILFSAPMVQALLAGRKTQTRRLRGLNAVNSDPGKWTWDGMKFYANREAACISIWPGECPLGNVGDRLWVRESYCPYYFDGGKHGYRADFDVKRLKGFCPEPRWKPSIHMSRAHSRMTLEITKVRVQRLQAISDTDAHCEGMEYIWGDGHGPRARRKWWGYGYHDGFSKDASGQKTYHAQVGSTEVCCCHAGQALRLSPVRCAFRALWENINGKGSWDRNPWVWAVSFRRFRVIEASA